MSQAVSAVVTAINAMNKWLNVRVAKDEDLERIKTLQKLSPLYKTLLMIQI